MVICDCPASSGEERSLEAALPYKYKVVIYNCTDAAARSRESPDLPDRSLISYLELAPFDGLEVPAEDRDRLWVRGGFPSSFPPALGNEIEACRPASLAQHASPSGALSRWGSRDRDYTVLRRRGLRLARPENPLCEASTAGACGERRARQQHRDCRSHPRTW